DGICALSGTTPAVSEDIPENEDLPAVHVDEGQPQTAFPAHLFRARNQTGRRLLRTVRDARPIHTTENHARTDVPSEAVHVQHPWKRSTPGLPVLSDAHVFAPL